MPNRLLDDLRARHAAACDEVETILNRSTAANRGMTADELATVNTRTDEAEGLARQIERLADEATREQRAAAVRQGAGTGAGDEAGALLLRAVTEASGIGAAATPPEYAAGFWGRLAPQSVFLAAGPQVISTSRDSLVIPRITGDPTAAWVAEAGTISASDPTGDTLTATPRKLAAMVRASNESLADSNPSVGEAINRGLARSLALAADLGAFEGSGTAPAIRGLRNVSGIGTASMGANGAALADLDPIADAIAAIEAANGTCSALFMAPRTWAKVSKLKEATGSNVPLVNGALGGVQDGARRSILGVPVYVSSQISVADTQGSSNAASRVYAVDMSQVVVVRRQDVAIEVDRSKYFDTDETAIRAITRLDVVVPNPAAVFVLTGVL